MAKNIEIKEGLDLRLKDVIKHLRYYTKFNTQEKIAKKIGMDKTSLSSALNGNKAYLTERTIDNFCNAFEFINKDWVLKEEGRMINSSSHIEENFTENKRLKELQNLLDFDTQKSFAEKLGIKQGTLSAIYKENRGGVSENIKRILREDFGVNIDWLEKGIGKPIKKELTQIIENEESYEAAINAGLKMIPEVDFVFSGGIACLTESKEYVQRWWYLPDCEDCEGVAPMQGTSMLPMFPPGCRLVLKRYGFDKRNPNTIAFGNAFGIVVEDPYTNQWHGHVKVLRRHKDSELSKKYWIAHSINTEEFDDFDIEIDQVRGLWIVKQHIVTNVIL